MEIPVNHHQGLQFPSCIVIGSDLYLILFRDHYLMRMDLKTRELRFVDVANVHPEKRIPTSALMQHEGKLVAVGRDMEYVHVYDPVHEAYEMFPLHFQQYVTDRNNFSFATIFQSEVFVFPCFDATLYRYQMDTHEVRSEDLPISCPPASEGERPVACIEAVCRVGNKVFLFAGHLRQMIVYDLRTWEAECLPLSVNIHSDDVLTDVSYRNGCFYLLTMRGNVFRLSLSKDGTVDCEAFLCEGADVESCQRILATDKNLWILPGIGTKIFVYDFDSGKLEEYRDYPNGFAYELFHPVQYKFFFGCEHEDAYIFSMCAENRILVVHRDTGHAEWKMPGVLSEKEKNRYLRAFVKANRVTENLRFPLEKFLSVIEQNVEDGEKGRNDLEKWQALFANL